MHLSAQQISRILMDFWSTYYVDGGKPDGAAYANPQMYDETMGRDIAEPCIVANFVEVWLAKRGHSNPVGINYLEKIQPPHLVSIYGAMLAGVDRVVMGAGIPNTRSSRRWAFRIVARAAPSSRPASSPAVTTWVS
jgi:nitronate monooxygenase